MKAKVSSEIRNGKMVNKKARDQLVRILHEFEGKTVEITVDKQKKSRSNPQNRYYWSIVAIARELINQAGNCWTGGEIHEYFKAEFLREESHIGEGILVNRVRSTTELSTEEMNEYIDRVREWIREYFNYAVPDPDEQVQLELS